MQLELFQWDDGMTAVEMADVLGEIRRHYWFVRNSRGTYAKAAKLRHYRRIAKHKKRLLLAGVEKRDLLDFLACCRKGCRAKECLQCVA